MHYPAELTDYLWPIICEMIKTAIENKQNLIVEGCYIPFDWEQYFTKEYLNNIKYYCLVMTENYIKNHFIDIKKYANVIEQRLEVSLEVFFVEGKQSDSPFEHIYAFRLGGISLIVISTC